MQTIKHTKGYKNIHWLLDQVEDAYRELSDESVDSVNQLWTSPYDSSLKPIFEIFKENSPRQFREQNFKDLDIKPLKLPKFDNKTIIVCYSGGKDSLTAIRHYQKLGYKVYAYHIKGLNKAYTDEYVVAEQAAERFGFELIFDEVGYSGQHVWIEHPMKNMIMANMALTYGVSHNITSKIAVGSFRTALLVDNAFDVCAGDCIDMWHLYESVVQRFIPKFKVYVPNYNFQTSYKAIVKEPDMLRYSMSCMTPNRFRNLFRKRTETKYKVDLLPNRCGCCWKCAAEYIYFTDMDILEYNQDYYIHCLEVLLHTLEQEIGYRVYSIPYVWDTYMLHISIRKSKAWGVLKNAAIRSGKIEPTN